MARRISMAAAVLAAVLAAAAMLQGTNAETYTVGDTTGWTIPPNTDFYDNWDENKSFAVGDKLIFNFATSAHDVAEVQEADYDNCNANAKTILIETTGPATIILNRTGDHYYICTFGNHCSRGQKLKVEVGAPTPGATPSPGSSPTSPSGGTTPSPSSASSLVATLSLVFISLALVFFC